MKRGGESVGVTMSSRKEDEKRREKENREGEAFSLTNKQDRTA